MEDGALKILIVDDDREIIDTLSTYLHRRGCSVSTALSATQMDTWLEKSSFDVLVVDLMMPGEDGLSICRRLGSDQPILMLSAMGDPSDRIVGLEMGAWDYLAKPFDPRELLARVRSLARRSSGTDRHGGGQRVLTFEGWTIDIPERRLLDEHGHAVNLSVAEFSLLAVFASRPQRLLSRDKLLELTRGLDSDVFDRTIDLTISRLRRKLGGSSREHPIETVRGGGYRFTPVVRFR